MELEPDGESLLPPPPAKKARHGAMPEPMPIVGDEVVSEVCRNEKDTAPNSGKHPHIYTGDR